jgi:hypothetical protein
LNESSRGSTPTLLQVVTDSKTQRNGRQDPRLLATMLPLKLSLPMLGLLLDTLGPFLP